MSEALERTKRSLDLIPYILEHQGISLEELARKFHVSTETLYEDLNMIFCCGLPGYTPLELIDMNLDDDYVSVSNPQVLDSPRKLSKQELLRLHLGLQFCERFAPESTKIRITKLQEQISSLLKLSAPIELIETVDENKLKIIVQALQYGKTLVFTYASASSDSLKKREVFPLGISESLNHVYLEAIPINESIKKMFRFDRMNQIALGENFDKSEKVTQVKSSTNEYQLFIDVKAKSFLAENSAIILESHASTNGFEVLIRGVSENWLISEIFAYGGEVRVTKPKELALKVARIATELLAKS